MVAVRPLTAEQEGVAAGLAAAQACLLLPLRQCRPPGRIVVTALTA